MNTLIGFTVNQSFGQVRTSSPRAEALLLRNLSLMLRNKIVRAIKKMLISGALNPTQSALLSPIPPTVVCGGSTPEAWMDLNLLGDEVLSGQF